jgi:hypothetical protein
MAARGLGTLAAAGRGPPRSAAVSTTAARAATMTVPVKMTIPALKLVSSSRA